MAEAKRDGNFVPVLLGASNADGLTPVNVYADPTTHRLLVDATAGAFTRTSVLIQKTTITSSVAETTIGTAIALTYLDLYKIIIANTSATACNVTIKDATAGTTRFIFAVPAGDTRGFVIPKESATPQNAVNNNWTATCSASVASIEITAEFIKNTT